MKGDQPLQVIMLTIYQACSCRSLPLPRPPPISSPAKPVWGDASAFSQRFGKACKNSANKLFISRSLSLPDFPFLISSSLHILFLFLPLPHLSHSHSLTDTHTHMTARSLAHSFPHSHSLTPSLAAGHRAPSAPPVHTVYSGPETFPRAPSVSQPRHRQECRPLPRKVRGHGGGVHSPRAM